MQGLFIQMSGLSGSGKTTLAQALAPRLRSKGFKVEIIDGDEYRSNLCSDLGFSKEDRNTNIRRLGFVGKVLARNSVVSIMSAINPYEEVRQELRREGAKLVYVSCPISVLKARDPKGLYKRACLPSDHPDYIPNFTGISDPFENPIHPDLTIHTAILDLECSVDLLENFILSTLNDPVGRIVWRTNNNQRIIDELRGNKFVPVSADELQEKLGTKAWEYLIDKEKQQILVEKWQNS